MGILNMKFLTTFAIIFATLHASEPEVDDDDLNFGGMDNLTEDQMGILDEIKELEERMEDYKCQYLDEVNNDKEAVELCETFNGQLDDLDKKLEESGAYEMFAKGDGEDDLVIDEDMMGDGGVLDDEEMASL